MKIVANILLSASAATLIAGCQPKIMPASEASSWKVTQIDPEQAETAYWLDRPAVVAVRAENFDKLWAATDRSARQYRFMPNRQDYRHGVLTTSPLISKQFFEVWQNDVVTTAEMARSSLATMRRTVRFDFEEKSPGEFEVMPKVVVERYVSSERRLTSIEQYTEAFSATRVEATSDESNASNIPTDYWYAVGRDNALEKRLAGAIAEKIPSAVIVNLPP